MSSKSSRNRARTRAVRAEMTRTGDNYTRSAARAGDSAHPSPEAGDRSGQAEGDGAAQVHVRRLLDALREEVQDRLRYIEELERAAGAERARARATLLARYNAGASIRELCALSGYSIGRVRRLLIEGEVTFRGRGGPHRRRRTDDGAQHARGG